MTWRNVCDVSTANILPDGSRRSRRQVGERLINKYIQEERELFIEDIGEDELEYAVLGSVTDDDDLDDGSNRHDDEDEDPDYEDDLDEEEEDDLDEQDDEDLDEQEDGEYDDDYTHDEAHDSDTEED